jgi:hypothetical protein
MRSCSWPGDQGLEGDSPHILTYLEEGQSLCACLEPCGHLGGSSLKLFLPVQVLLGWVGR